MSNVTIQNSHFLNGIYRSSLNEINNLGINALNGSRGKTILETEQDVLCYISAYFAHHITKAFYIFEKVDLSNLEGYIINIVDWASGPGTASLAFLEYCKVMDKKLDISSITLIDAGNAALDIGNRYLRNCLDDQFWSYKLGKPEISIRHSYLCESDFPDLCGSEITIHFLSNMLDLGLIDKVTLSNKISMCSTEKQIIFCMGPSYLGHQLGLARFDGGLKQNTNILQQEFISTTIYVTCYMFRSNSFRLQPIYVDGKIYEIRRN